MRREEQEPLAASGGALKAGAAIGAALGLVFGLHLALIAYCLSDLALEYAPPRPPPLARLLPFLVLPALTALLGAVALGLVTAFGLAVVAVVRAKPEEGSLRLRVARAVVVAVLLAAFVVLVRALMRRSGL
jgi:hypothetical protein